MLVSETKPGCIENREVGTCSFLFGSRVILVTARISWSVSDLLACRRVVKFGNRGTLENPKTSEIFCREARPRQ